MCYATSGMPSALHRPQDPHPNPLPGSREREPRPAADVRAALSDPAAAAAALGVPFADTLAAYPTSAEFVSAVPIAFARRHTLLGLTDPDPAAAEPRLPVAVGDPAAWPQLQVVARFLNRPVRPVFAPAAVVLAAISDAYQQRTGQAQAVIESFDRAAVLDELARLTGGREDLLDNAARAPVIKLVNLILSEAVRAGASDVHVQPSEAAVMVRMRIDGVLYDSYPLPKSVQEEAVSRLKVMGRMNIAEKRLSQDGRATVQIGDRSVDLRIASLPTSFGERVVVRLLDRSARLYDLAELGMDAAALASFARLITAEHGLVLVTGPTGSGKSTTLYSALARLNAKERNILTLEDPIEYQLEGISQTQVSEKKGDDLRQGAAERAPAGPRRDHGRRGPRPGDGHHGHPVVAHRPPGLQHPAHERRRHGRHPAARFGHRTVPGRQQPDRRPRPAAGPPRLPRLRRPAHRHRRRTPGGSASTPPRSAGGPAVPTVATPATAAASAPSSCCR